MIFNKKVVNGKLGGAIEIMKSQPGEEGREMVMEEILKAHFLCPATLSMPPIAGQNGDLELAHGCGIMWCMLADAQNRPLLMAFTSEEELNQWKSRSSAGESYYFACNMVDYLDILLHKGPNGEANPAQGIVIDPYDANLLLDKDMIANLMVRLQMRGRN